MSLSILPWGRDNLENGRIALQGGIQLAGPDSNN